MVCSGAKAVLDLPLTLEVLESYGVPVVAIGTRNLPAFYSVDSGLRSPAHVQDLEAAGNVVRAWRQVDAGNGMLLTVPVPADSALDPDEAAAVVERAVAEADERGIAGHELTPYLLRRIVELTDGRALRANKALLINNAEMAARLSKQAGDAD